MNANVTIENGFAEVGAGTWLAGRGQPAAFFGDAARRGLKGWFVRDRSSLDVIQTTGRTLCADSSRPFLTHIPCAAPVTVVSAKVLVAPVAARTGAELVKVVPMSLKGSFAVTKFEKEWVATATASRTTRLVVEDGGTLSVRPESTVAWTGNRPTGFVRRLRLRDILLPRAPRDLMLHFHGPCIVWVEGTEYRPRRRRVYGV